MITQILHADCGCEFEISRDGSWTNYRWCPLHKSASDLKEAVRWTLEDHRDGRTRLPVSTHTQLLKALNKAEGK